MVGKWRRRGRRSLVSNRRRGSPPGPAPPTRSLPPRHRFLVAPASSGRPASWTSDFGGWNRQLQVSPWRPLHVVLPPPWCWCCRDSRRRRGCVGWHSTLLDGLSRTLKRHAGRRWWQCTGSTCHRRRGDPFAALGSRRYRAPSTGIGGSGRLRGWGGSNWTSLRCHLPLSELDQDFR